MLYVKNVPAWERTLRVLSGVAIAGFGLYRFPGSLLGHGLAATGVFAMLTGFLGFCPACYLVGRKLDQGS